MLDTWSIFSIYLEAISSVTGFYTSGLLTIGIALSIAITWFAGSNTLSKKRKIVFWSFFSLAVLGIITNSYMRDYSDEHLKTIITCTNTNIYPPMTFDHNVSIYHTSERSVLGYGTKNQVVEIWTDGERCDFMNKMMDI